MSANLASSWPALGAPPAAFRGPLLPRQSARCLAFIAEHPGSSSTEVQAGVGIRHPSQICYVLMRLERDGLAHTDRGLRARNAWRLTLEGRRVLRELEAIWDVYETDPAGPGVSTPRGGDELAGAGEGRGR